MDLLNTRLEIFYIISLARIKILKEGRKQMTLNVGDSAPDFEFISDGGAVTKLHELDGIKIVYFFPKAFTPGCTKESCSIRDTYDDLKENGISEVIGISTDSYETQKKFQKKYNLPFPIISDNKKIISKAYKVYKNYLLTGFSKRVTYLIDSNNKIVSVKDLGLKGGNSDYGLKNYGKELLENIKIEN